VDWREEERRVVLRIEWRDGSMAGFDLPRLTVW
jgi:hypothetical protein